MLLMKNSHYVPKNKFIIKIASYLGLEGIFLTENENLCSAANF